MLVHLWHSFANRNECEEFDLLLWRKKMARKFFCLRIGANIHHVYGFAYVSVASRRPFTISVQTAL